MILYSTRDFTLFLVEEAFAAGLATVLRDEIFLAATLAFVGAVVPVTAWTRLC